MAFTTLDGGFVFPFESEIEKEAEVSEREIAQLETVKCARIVEVVISCT